MNHLVIEAWAAFTNNNPMRFKSSSGGIFYELSNSIIVKKGVVYGVAMNADQRSAQYVRVTNPEDISKILGSKYLQVKMDDTFNYVKSDLDTGKWVMFSGTGCTINALVKFLPRKYKNLICVDVICHGIPSSLLWEKYVNELEEIEKNKTISVNFRSKRNGWENFGLLRENENSEFTLSLAKDDPYLQLFLRNYSLRPSCYQCRAKLLRYADITLGDFWGISHIAPEMDDGNGTSLVIIRTNKGLDFFIDIKGNLRLKKVNYSDAIKYNQTEYLSVEMPKERSLFFEDFKKLSFSDLSSKYLYFTLRSKIKRIILNSPLKVILPKR